MCYLKFFQMNYTVKDMNGETPSVNSWMSGHGVMTSPMEWTENCILFFYGIDLSDETYTNIIVSNGSN